MIQKNKTIENIIEEKEKGADFAGQSCGICPRNCKICRNSGEKGYCREDSRIYVARAALHFWEEPCISGTKGSGAVFFCGCNMGCVFCQNYEISRGQAGYLLTIEELADIFVKLQEQGGNNLNLVTPTHYTPQIAKALKLAEEKGFSIPVVYNCGGYESVETLKMLEGLVDIYLPDCKYASEELAVKYSNAPHYFETALSAIDEMVRQCPKPEFDEKGIMQTGVIVRHLQLPKQLMDSKKVIKTLYERFGEKIYFSLMSQYTTVNKKQLENYPELQEKVKRKNYNKLVDYAISLGITQAFIQEGDVAKESFIPPFNGEGLS